MIIGGSALAIWMSISPLIVDNMNNRECFNASTGDSISSNSKVINSVQGLYTWLTIILFISFIGIVKGIRGITDVKDVYDVKNIFPLLYISSIIIIIFISALKINSNPIVKAMTSDFVLDGPDGKSGSTIPANHTASTFLTTVMTTSCIAMVGVFIKGKEMMDNLNSSTASSRGSDGSEYGNYDASAYS